MTDKSRMNKYLIAYFMTISSHCTYINVDITTVLI